MLDEAEDEGAGGVDAAAGGELDEAGVADADGLELAAGAEFDAGVAELIGGVAAEALGAAAGSDDEPDDPPPQDAHSSAAMTITTARMGRLLPIPARCSRFRARCPVVDAGLGLGAPDGTAAGAVLKSKVDARASMPGGVAAAALGQIPWSCEARR